MPVKGVDLRKRRVETLGGALSRWDADALWTTGAQLFPDGVFSDAALSKMSCLRLFQDAVVQSYCP